MKRTLKQMIGRRVTVVAVLLSVSVVAVLVAIGSAGAATTPTALQPLPLSQVKLVSYYPADASWSNEWVNFDPTQMNTDFAKIASTGANTVRLILAPSTTGYPQMSTVMAQELAQAMTIAANNGLHVQLTLFDWFHSYTDIAGSQAWITSVLSPYMNDNQIAFIEIRNEIDPTDPVAMAWANAVIPMVRGAAGTIPLTISVTGAASVVGLFKSELTSPLDFYDFHYFGSAGLAFSVFAAAQALAAPTPLFIGEVGMSTYSASGAAAETALQSQQAAFLSITEADTVALGLPLAGIWMFNDLLQSGVPTGVYAPAGGPGQLYFGLYNPDGTPKPAAAVVQQVFSQTSEPTLINPGFETGSGGVPNGWTPTGVTTGNLLWDQTVGHTGSASVSIGGATTQASWSQLANTGPIKTGDQVQATVWAEATNSTGWGTVALAWYTSNGTYISNVVSTPLTSGNWNWTQLGVNATAPAGAAYAMVYLQSNPNTGVIHFDDATVMDYGAGSVPALPVVPKTSGVGPTLTNTAFVTLSGSAPAGWTSAAGSSATMAEDQTVGYPTAPSVSISGSGSSAASWSEMANTGALTTGEELQATVWAEGTGSTGGNVITISWYNAAGAWITSAASPVLPGGNSNWTELGVNATTPAGAASATVYLQSTSNTGVVHFDDVGLTIVGSGAFPALPAVPKTSGVGPTLANAGFETGSGTLASSWAPTAASSGTLAWDQTAAHSGTASVSIGSVASQASWSQMVNTGALTTGEELQATVWAEAANSTGWATVAVAWYSATGAYLGNSVSAPLTTGSWNWTELGVNATAPAGAAYATVFLQSSASTGVFHFDDANVTMVGSGAFPAIPPIPKTSGVGPTLLNASFETGSGVSAASWTASAASTGTLSWDPTVANTGTASVLIQRSASQASWSQQANTGPLTTGEEVQATVWAEGTNSTGGNVVTISWYTTSGAWITSSVSGVLPAGTTGWTELLVNAAAPAGAATAVVYLQSTSNTGTVHFDDASLTVVGSGAYPAMAAAKTVKKVA